MRTAFFSMDWNTGFSSPGELLMTLNTSAVAVCCSSASESSRVLACTFSNSRVFSMAITAWSARVCNKPEISAIAQVYRRVVSSAEAACDARNTVEHRLKIELRAADDGEHIARCRLVFECLRELARACLLRLEEARVLDGDYGLIG